MEVTSFSEEYLGATLDFARRARPQFSFSWAHSEALFRWKYLDQVQSLADGAAPAWIVRDSERVVGFLGSMVSDYWFDGEVMPGNAAMDLYLDPACRGHGVGKELLRRYEDSARLKLMILSTPQAHAIYLGRGYRELAGVRAHYGIWGTRALLRWGLRKFKLSRFEYSPPEDAERLRDLLLAVPGIRVPGAEDAQRVDAHLHGSQQQYGLAPLRSYAYLDWKYRRHPDRHGEIFLLDEGGEIAALFALANRRLDGPPMLALGDLFVRQPDDVATIRRVIKLCACVARATGAHASVALDPGNSIGRELRAATRTRSTDLLCSLRVDDSDFSPPPAQIYLSAGDGDFIR